MIVVISTAGTEHRHEQGESWRVDRQGRLAVCDVGGDPVAVYSAARWDSVRREYSDVVDETAE